VNRRILGISLLLVLLLAALGLALFYRTSPSPAAPRPSGKSPHIAESLTPSGAPASSPAGGATQDAATESQRLAGEADLALVSVKGMLRDYRAQFAENPVGTNREITLALTGKNPGGAIFESAEAKIENGQLVDRWHHPYFFHQLSGTEMEIRSAGPDGVLWTEDDEVLR
jgi:hypothetical protein